MDGTTLENVPDVNRSLILLVKPSAGTVGYTRADRFRTSLSLAALAAGLRDARFLHDLRDRLEPAPSDDSIENTDPFTVKVLDLSQPEAGKSAEQRYRAFVESTGAYPLIVGVTANSGQIEEALSIAEAARECTPHSFRMVGGPHASVAPETFLEESRYHLACLGDGVETLAEAALKLRAHGRIDPALLDGTAHRDDRGSVQCRPARAYRMVPDDYPFPSTALDLFVDDLDDEQANGKEIVYVLAGTGCPFNCTFCAQRAIHHGSIRERSGANLLAEIEGLLSMGFRRFALVQESFFSNRRRVEEFCGLIEQKGLSFQWTVEARADQVDESLLARAKKGGLRFIQIGLESGDQDLLDSVDKKIRLPQVEKLIAACRDLRIDTALYMLVGLPGQGWQSILRSATFIRDHVPYNTATLHLSVAVAIPYPGTGLSRTGGIRMLPPPGQGKDWPTRNPDVSVDDEGEFGGRNFTETDAMESGEILEAMVFLDYFGQFLLHAVLDPTLDSEQRFRAERNALIMFSLIEHRAARDAVVRAHEFPMPEARRTAYRELAAQRETRDERVRNVAEYVAPSPGPLTEFLCRVTFLNGFGIMKHLSAPRRFDWMKVCAAAWLRLCRRASRVRFEADEEKYGEQLDSVLGKADAGELDEMLRTGNMPFRGVSMNDVPAAPGEATIFGMNFRSEDGGEVLTVSGFVHDLRRGV